MDMADQIARSTGSTRGMAASVLNQVASSGKVAGDSLEVVSTAVVNMSKVTGQSVDQLVSDFDKIAGSPLDSISKLNDQYHFLSLAVYNQIKALQDEGNQQEAARLATETYAATMNRRAKDIHDNLGFVETARNSLGAAAKSAWDQMLNVGRESTLQEKLEAAKNAAQQQASGLGNGLWNTYGVNSASGTGAAAEVSILQNVINLQNDMTSAIAAGQAAQDKSIKPSRKLTGLISST